MRASAARDPDGMPGADGTVAFVRRLRGRDASNRLPPGGGIGPDESAEVAALRESREGTGIAARSCSACAGHEFTGVREQGGHHPFMPAFPVDGAYAPAAEGIRTHACRVLSTAGCGAP